MHRIVHFADWICSLVPQHGVKSMSSRIKFTNLMAKALYDNRAESADELAFRKGDILTVIEQNVKGNAGWWRCSLHGRQGFAPGNRLQLLASPEPDKPPLYMSHYLTTRRTTPQNIYLTPKSSSIEAPSKAATVPMPRSHSVQQTCSQIYQVPTKSPAEPHRDLESGASSQAATLPQMQWDFTQICPSRPQSDTYDVPPFRYGTSQVCSPATHRKHSMFQTPEERKQVQQLYDIPPSFEKYLAPVQPQVYDIPATRDSAYDIPAPLGRGGPEKAELGQSHTQPSPSKPDWSSHLPEDDPSKDRRALAQSLYDVPVPRGEAAVSAQARYDSLPAERPPLWAARPDCGTAANRAEAGAGRGNPPSPAKDGPGLARAALYDIPTSRERANGPGIYDVPVNSQPKAAQDPKSIYDIPTATVAKQPQQQPAAAAAASAAGQERPSNNSNDGVHAHKAPPPASARAKTESPETPAPPTASTAPPAEPGPEPVREITLDPDSAVETLVRLQRRLADSVAAMMAFVSSKWRLLEHLEQHIEEIRSSAQAIMESLGALMGFVRGVRVNSARLTDCNVQARLCKQLQILEDSHQIMVETSLVLQGCQWSLSALVVSQPQANPDNLDRFVMVTRTVPEDVKRLLSIIIANGKLLFRRLEKPEDDNPPEETPSATQPPALSYHLSLQRRCNRSNFGQRSSVSTLPHKGPASRPSVMPRLKRTQTEDCDYVHLQRKEDFELEQKEKESIREKKPPPAIQPKDVKANKLVENNRLSHKEGRPASSSTEHCRMFLNALHKAVVSFNSCMDGGQGPEALIKHSKVIIMIGQKLVDMMCRESEAKGVHKEVLSTSNQFCNVLKNLAMATKRAVVQPDVTAGFEIREQVAEISQHAEHFRALLELKL